MSFIDPANARLAAFHEAATKNDAVAPGTGPLAKWENDKATTGGDVADSKAARGFFLSALEKACPRWVVDLLLTQPEMNTDAPFYLGDAHSILSKAEALYSDRATKAFDVTNIADTVAAVTGGVADKTKLGANLTSFGQELSRLMIAHDGNIPGIADLFSRGLENQNPAQLQNAREFIALYSRIMNGGQYPDLTDALLEVVDIALDGQRDRRGAFLGNGAAAAAAGPAPPLATPHAAAAAPLANAAAAATASPADFKTPEPDWGSSPFAKK